MSRNRASAKAAGANGKCFQCGIEIPSDALGRNVRKYCSNACLNAERRSRYTPKEPKPSRPVSDRFWEKVSTGNADECWEYMGYRMPFGYGQFGVNGGVVLTHRLAWELAANGPIPQGQLVRHKCDNPPCCNPNHLELGDYADNSRDAIERGRIARGFQIPSAVLSESDVIEIRRRYEPGAGGRGNRSNADELSQQFGVSAKYVKAVARGEERVDV